MKIRNMLLGATLLVAPFAAHAQPVSGIYVGAGLGYNYLQQVNVTPGNAGHFAGSSGVAGVGSVGYGFGNGMRVELEGNYRFNHSGLKGGVIHGNTDAQTYGAMVNGLYDFDIGQSWIYPYLGAGVGYEATQLNGATYTGPGGSGTMKTSTKGGFAAQGIVGAGFPIPGAPGLSLTAEYRFMAVVESETFHTTAGDIKIGNQYNHSALVGLRYAFGAAPAAPAPA
ncbi:MAG: porin family protein, partial [Rhodospirillales bacterium]|nr:porin family protein [Rhodospirillales bacterium]